MLTPDEKREMRTRAMELVSSSFSHIRGVTRRNPVPFYEELYRTVFNVVLHGERTAFRPFIEVESVKMLGADTRTGNTGRCEHILDSVCLYLKRTEDNPHNVVVGCSLEKFITSGDAEVELRVEEALALQREALLRCTTALSLVVSHHPPFTVWRRAVAACREALARKDYFYAAAAYLAASFAREKILSAWVSACSSIDEACAFRNIEMDISDMEAGLAVVKRRKLEL